MADQRVPIAKSFNPGQLHDELRPVAGMVYPDGRDRFTIEVTGAASGSVLVYHGDEDEAGNVLDPVDIADVEAVIAAHVKKPDPVTSQTLALGEDVERLALVRERAETDPAFAALAELTLGKEGV